MIAFADKLFYTGEYLCGKEAVINTAFDFYARKASQEIKRFTFDNVDETNIPKCVKMCCCEIAEILFKYGNSEAIRGISSEKVGDLSVSYESSESTKLVLEKDIRMVVYTWLSGTGLLYRGVR